MAIVKNPWKLSKDLLESGKFLAARLLGKCQKFVGFTSKNLNRLVLRVKSKDVFPGSIRSGRGENKQCEI